MNARFKFSQRLHRPEEYAAVLSSRPTMRGDWFVMHFRAIANDPVAGMVPRLGLVIPKRLAKAASVRNAIKRQVREAFRLHAATLPLLDVVVRLNRPVKTAGASVLPLRTAWRSEAEALLQRVAGSAV